MFAFPFALTYTFGRIRRQPAPGLDDLRGDGRGLRRRRGRRDARRGDRQPAVPGGRRPGARQHGGQGVAVRRGRRRPVRGRHDGTSTGAINAWHDSFQPIGGLVPLFNIELGEITPGGIGAGLYGMLVIGAILAVFIAGLMVGRTPEYLGKKVEAFEMKMAMLVVLVLGASILGFTALATVTAGGPGRPAQRRAARLQRDPLRVREPDRQQRLGVRRADRQHALLQHHRRLRDAPRPLRDDRPDPRPGRLDGRQAPRRALARARSRRPGVLFGVLLDRRDHHRRRARRSSRRSPSGRSSSSSSRTPERSSDHEPHSTLQSVDLGRGTRRFQRFVTPSAAPSRPAEPPRPRGVLDPDLLRAALPAVGPQARPAAADQEPGHVRRRDHRGLVTLDRPSPTSTGLAAGRRPGRARLPGPDRGLAVVHGPVRHLRRGRRRGARPGPGRDPPQDPVRDDGPPPPGRRVARGRRLVRAPAGRHHRRRGGRDDPRRRRRHRGRRLTSTRRRSPASRRRSSRSRAPTSGARSPAARRSPATGSSSASRPTPARPSSTG